MEFESEAGVVDFSLGTAATIEELNQKNEELQQALQEKVGCVSPFIITTQCSTVTHHAIALFFSFSMLQ